MGFLQLAKLLDDTSVDMAREMEVLQGCIHIIHILGILEAVRNGTANSPIFCTGLITMVCTNAAGVGSLSEWRCFSSSRAAWIFSSSARCWDENVLLALSTAGIRLVDRVGQKSPSERGVMLCAPKLQ